MAITIGCRVASATSPTAMALQCLKMPGLSLFLEPPPAAASRSWLEASGLGNAASGICYAEDALDVSPSVLPTVTLFMPQGVCECAYDVEASPNGLGLRAQVPKSHGPRSSGQRHFTMSAERALLRIVAPDSATPGLNWALGLDALRVLEARTPNGDLDWLVSVDAEDVGDIR